MAQGDINDPLTNIPDIVVVDQSSGAAAPGEGYARLGVINGVLSVRIGTGEWTPIAVGLDGPTLHALAEKATPVDADELLLADSEDSWAAKRATRGTVKGEGGTGELTVVSATLADNVALDGDSWHDVLSITLVAGTWAIWAVAQYYTNANILGYLRIHDGTNTLATASDEQGNYGSMTPLMVPSVVYASETVVKLQGRGASGTPSIMSAAPDNPDTTEVTTRIMALKLA